MTDQNQTTGTEAQKYLIWSNEHVAWWRPASMGYTVSIEHAGRYSRDEAMEICRGANFGFMQDDENPNEIPVLEVDAAETMRSRPWQARTGMRKKRIVRHG